VTDRDIRNCHYAGILKFDHQPKDGRVTLRQPVICFQQPCWIKGIAKRRATR